MELAYHMTHEFEAKKPLKVVKIDGVDNAADQILFTKNVKKALFGPPREWDLIGKTGAYR